MTGKFKLILVILLVFFVIHPVYAYDTEALLHEDFNDLENWKPFYFKKVKEHTQYSIEKAGDRNYLKAKSDSSASGIIFKKKFNVYEYPRVKWLWKISNVYQKGNALKKSGDDYPIRVYIIFKYNPAKASFGKRIKYGLVKKIYGEYPPHSSLNYIWANRKHKKNIITNTYANESKMIILQTGAEKAGKWLDEEINIIKDYRKSFGAEPPATASIAIMNDSDNTKESSVSYIDYIEVGK